MKLPWRYLALCGLLSWLLLQAVEQGQRPFVIYAQSEQCIVQVYYGDGGLDQGDCRDPANGLCATADYALEQGLQVCPETVQIFNNGMLVRMYRAPIPPPDTPLRWLLAGLYWAVPLLLGGFAGWRVGQGHTPRGGGRS
jgi:hypothetical protein